MLVVAVHPHEFFTGDHKGNQSIGVNAFLPEEHRISEAYGDGRNSDGIRGSPLTVSSQSLVNRVIDWADFCLMCGENF